MPCFERPGKGGVWEAGQADREAVGSSPVLDGNSGTRLQLVVLRKCSADLCETTEVFLGVLV